MQSGLFTQPRSPFFMKVLGAQMEASRENLGLLVTAGTQGAAQARKPAGVVAGIEGRKAQVAAPDPTHTTAKRSSPDPRMRPVEPQGVHPICERTPRRSVARTVCRCPCTHTPLWLLKTAGGEWGIWDDDTEEQSYLSPQGGLSENAHRSHCGSFLSQPPAP